MKITVLEYCKLFIRTSNFYVLCFQRIGRKRETGPTKKQRTITVEEHLVTRGELKSLLWHELRLEPELPVVLNQGKSSKYQTP